MNGSKFKGWYNVDVKHVVKDESCFDKIVCALCHNKAFYYARVCSACLSRKLGHVAITFVRGAAFYASIHFIDLFYSSNVLSKR